MTAGSRPNIVLITIDCLRYDRCGFNGYSKDTTPTLDALSADGCVFENAYAPGPYTPESFPGILAGRHGFNSSVYDDVIWKALQPDERTLASEASERGYETVARVTNPHLTPQRNFDRGFGSYRNLRTDSTNGTTDDTGAGERALSQGEQLLKRGRRTAGSAIPSPLQCLSYSIFRYWQSTQDWPSIRGETVIDQFNRTLAGRDQPFLAWTHLMDLHAPIHPDTGHDLDSGTFSRLYADGKRMLDKPSEMYSDVYDSALQYVDGQVSRVINKLKQIGAWEDTILVVTADHGEAIYDRGTHGHPYHYMYDELLHVPLLLRVPDSMHVSPPPQVKEYFSLAWLHELLADVAGLDRFDLAATTNRESHLKPDYTPSVISDSISDFGHSIAIRNESELLIRHYGEKTSPNPVEQEIMAEYTGQNLVYRHGEEVGETKSGEFERLAEELRTNPEDLPRIGDELSDEVESQLRDLGYVN